MHYILEDNKPLEDAEGVPLTYHRRAEALQIIDYFNDDLIDYRVVSMLDYVMNKENHDAL